MPNTPIENAGYKTLDGMRLLWISSRTLTVTAGQARSSSNINDILFEEDLTLDIDVLGPGGIDVGIIQPNRIYHLFAIGDSTKNLTPNVLASISTTPVLNNYDVHRMIGAFRTRIGPADIDTFAQTGIGEDRWITYEEPFSVLTTGNATAWIDVDLSLAVPLGRNMSNIMCAHTPAVAGDRVLLRKNASAGSGSAIFSGDVAAVQSWGEVLVPYGDGAIIEYQVDNAGDAVDLYLKAYLHSL